MNMYTLNIDENKRNCYTFPWRYILSLFYLLTENVFSHKSIETKHTIIFELCLVWCCFFIDAYLQERTQFCLKDACVFTVTNKYVCVMCAIVKVRKQQSIICR